MFHTCSTRLSFIENKLKNEKLSNYYRYWYFNKINKYESCKISYRIGKVCIKSGRADKLILN